MMWLSNVFAGAMCIFLALIIRVWKVSGLIAGYNTMPEKEKAKVDEAKLIRYTSNMLFTLGTVLLVPGILSMFIFPTFLITASWILFTIGIITGVAIMNTGNRIKKQPYSD